MRKRREPDGPDPDLDGEEGAAGEWEDGAGGDRFEEGGGWPAGSEGSPGQAGFGPPRNRRVWITLGLICVTFAVAVLYVYQAGDDKTVLGNQPILAAQPEGPPPARARASATAGSAPLTVVCPHCRGTGMPMCSRCRSVMQPLGGGSGLFVCPSCGTAGMPICPRCGGHMIATHGAGGRAPAELERPAGVAM